jgi:hypothetical protein
MRKITFVTLLLIASNTLFSQTSKTIDYFNWSNPSIFHTSPSPIITGYGTYSDSLSLVFEGKAFYEYNDEYYCIESWADYYFWFTQKYWFEFNDPGLYEYYYWTKDDFGMTSYIASHKYLGKYYPSLIKLNFGNTAVEENRLNTNRYIAQNTKAINEFSKQLKDNSAKKYDKPAETKMQNSTSTGTGRTLLKSNEKQYYNYNSTNQSGTTQNARSNNGAANQSGASQNNRSNNSSANQAGSAKSSNRTISTSNSLEKIK